MSKYRLSFKNATDLLKYAQEQGVQYINCNFTDLRGKWHHSSQSVSASSTDTIKNGIVIDGSLIAGGKDDYLIKPDLARVSYDPFAAQKTIKIICDVIDVETNKPHFMDPRNVAKKAQNYLTKGKIGDKAYFGSEIEFFVFDDVTC